MLLSVAYQRFVQRL